MIYLDNAATTRPDGQALSRAAEEAFQHYFNPSARYGGGFLVHRLIEEARSRLLASVASAENYELEFTSGGTEADNHAVFSGARRGNAVTSAGEHSAVYESFVALRGRGVEPRFAPVRRDGSVDPERLLSLVDEKTTFVSVVHVNNETGAINEIGALAQAVKEKNPRCVFHSDGVQAFGKLPGKIPPAVDLYSVSAHKIGGLKGTGALIRRKGLALPPYLFGGGQEGGLRSGTENVLGILAFSYAAERKFGAIQGDHVRVDGIARRTRARLEESGLFAVLSPENGSPYILTVACEGVRGEVLQRMLYDRGVAVGTGSACSSKKPHSRIIEACGYKKSVLDGVLRLSFSPETAEDEAAEAAEILCNTAKELKEKLS